MIRASLTAAALSLSITLAATAQQSSPGPPDPPVPAERRVADEASEPATELEQLQEQNQLLRLQVEHLQTQLEQLGATPDPATPSPLMRRALQQTEEDAPPALPVITLKGKVVAGDGAVAQLAIGEQEFLVREGREMQLFRGAAGGTAMRVEKVSDEVVELEFPELEQSVSLY